MCLILGSNPVGVLFGITIGLGCILTPLAILRWYRQLVAAKYDGPKVRGPGRPRTADELRALVVSMAVDNPT